MLIITCVASGLCRKLEAGEKQRKSELATKLASTRLLCVAHLEVYWYFDEYYYSYDNYHGYPYYYYC